MPTLLMMIGFTYARRTHVTLLGSKIVQGLMKPTAREDTGVTG